MKKNLKLLLACVLLLLPCGLFAESVTYEIVEYNKDKADFTLKAYGQRPIGSEAFFENEYGATTGNRYNQIPRNKEATLYLTGWEGCVVNSVTLNMCSNAKSGAFALIVTNGSNTLYTMSAKDFESDEWFGQWVSKDLGVYVDLKKEMQETMTVGSDELQIKLRGGTSEGSVYINRITIDYTPSAIGTESPMGWAFTKLEKNATLNEGDVVMMYRDGLAAGDIDGMQTSFYLDAIGVTSTSSVYESDIEYFTLAKDGVNWTLTNADGKKLGASGAQHLVWDEGVTTWSITLGYDGATIANTNTNYGTMRYNAPASSYPRFWNYKSTSLKLPYLYRRGAQNQPVASTAITLSASTREVDMAEQDTVVLKATFSPTIVTDTRVAWSSSDESVATVRSGIVNLHSTGTAIITAESLDGGSMNTCTLNVKNTSTSIDVLNADSEEATATYDLNGRQITAMEKGIVVKKYKDKRSAKVLLK